MAYALARPLLFALEPETAHAATLTLAHIAQRCGLLGIAAPRVRAAPVNVMGLAFPNPVGLAAGLDKNAAHIDVLGALGFGFIEVGTVTPRPQPGNPRPRLFRIPEGRALINRFGFNNVGLDAFLENVARARWRGVLGINLGKNADTPAERAVDDYQAGLEQVYTAASYVAINVSSPNTKDLRALQDRAALDALLTRLVATRERLADRHGKRVPLVLKVAPDLEPPQIADIAEAVRRHRIDGVIATNTSVARNGVERLTRASEAGGLSGAPIRARATQVLGALARALAGEVPLIGVGGIMTGDDALEKIAEGASLVQLYTGLIYRGPALVAECVATIAARAGPKHGIRASQN